MPRLVGFTIHQKLLYTALISYRSYPGGIEKDWTYAKTLQHGAPEVQKLSCLPPMKEGKLNEGALD